MKTVGFVDYYLDEWHANNYPAWIEESAEKLGVDYKLAYAWAEIDSPNGLTTDEWCEKFGAVRCASIEELCEKADCVIVLSPSNPECHLGYAKRVFACGKSPYIDKTFTETAAEAAEIIAESEKCGVKFFSSSALRYAEEIAPYASSAKAVRVLGGGGTIDEYIIHQIEMAVKCLGIGAVSVQHESHADQEYVSVRYNDDRYASLTFIPGVPFEIAVADKSGSSTHMPIVSAFFSELISDIIRFFESGETSFDVAETLEVMKIREATLRSKAAGGAVIEL